MTTIKKILADFENRLHNTLITKFTLNETEEIVKEAKSSHSHLIEEIIKMAQEMKRMESDYDDEDKTSRRDVPPYNEAITDFITNLSTLNKKR